MTAAFLPLLALAGVLPGCPATDDVRRQPAPVTQVDKVDLLAPLQPLIDLDGKPGYDGLVVEVRFYRLDEVRSVPVTGALEVILFEGTLNRADLAQARPFHSARFARNELLVGEGVDHFGLLAYRLPVAWGPAPPKGGTMTVVARYLPPEGRPVYSDPMAVPLRLP